MKHHEDTRSFEKQFRKDVEEFFNTMWKLGNPFGDTDNNLVNLISKNIMDENAVASVIKAATINMKNMKQYEDFVVKRLGSNP